MARPRSPWDRDSIIAAIRAFEEQHGRPPRMGEWQHAATEHPNRMLVVRRFGKWSNAIRAAGLEPGHGEPGFQPRKLRAILDQVSRFMDASEARDPLMLAVELDILADLSRLRAKEIRYEIDRKPKQYLADDTLAISDDEWHARMSARPWEYWGTGDG